MSSSGRKPRGRHVRGAASAGRGIGSSRPRALSRTAADRRVEVAALGGRRVRAGHAQRRLGQRVPRGDGLRIAGRQYRRRRKPGSRLPACAGDHRAVRRFGSRLQAALEDALRKPWDREAILAYARENQWDKRIAQLLRAFPPDPGARADATGRPRRGGGAMITSPHGWPSPFIAAGTRVAASHVRLSERVADIAVATARGGRGAADAKLNRLLQIALQHTPWHARRIRDAGLEALVRAAKSRRRPCASCRRWTRGMGARTWTSWCGAARRAACFRTTPALERRAAAVPLRSGAPGLRCRRAHARAELVGVNVGDPEVYVWGAPAELAKNRPHQDHPRPARESARAECVRDVAGEHGRLSRRGSSFPARCIYGYASSVALLRRRARRAGDHLRLRNSRLSARPGSRSTRISGR